MKNFFIVTVLVLLILIGCNKGNSISFDRYLEEISEIIYNDVQLVRDDFETISNLLYEIEFTNKTPKNLSNPISKIYLITIEGSKYEFNIFKNNIIEYKNGKRKYYNTGSNSDLVNLYDDLKQKYTDLSLFNIIPSNDDPSSNNVISLLADKEETDLSEEIQMFKLIINDPIYKLKVIANNKTIYEKEKLEINDYIYFKFLFNDSFKITFNNKFNSSVELMPNYSNKIITFDKRIKLTL